MLYCEGNKFIGIEVFDSDYNEDFVIDYGGRFKLVFYFKKLNVCFDCLSV